MTRCLGAIQNDMMRALQRPDRSGFWFSGCGWFWDTHSGTIRLCESLCKRGLLTKSAIPGETARYDLTVAGRAYTPYK